MSSSNQSKDLDALRNTLASTTALIHSFQSTLQASNPSHPSIKDPPNPLALLSDASQILKAQTTKISLLILNKPYTPTAITHILTTLSSSCLPALMTGLELCQPEKYTAFLQKHIRTTLSRLWAELLTLLACIPQTEPLHPPNKQSTLSSTGVLWAQCDVLTSLNSTTLTQLISTHITTSHALLTDAISELDDWDPDSPSSSSSSSSSSSPTPPIHTPPTSDEETLPSPLHHPPLNPILPLKTRALKHLRLVKMLPPALLKRRIATLPDITSTTPWYSWPFPETLEEMDAIIVHVQAFSDEADEIVGALYEGEVGEVEGRLEVLREEARGCMRRVRRGWGEEEDGFSGWVDRWVGRLGEVERG